MVEQDAMSVAIRVLKDRCQRVVQSGSDDDSLALVLARDVPNRLGSLDVLGRRLDKSIAILESTIHDPTPMDDDCRVASRLAV